MAEDGRFTAPQRCWASCDTGPNATGQDCLRLLARRGQESRLTYRELDIKARAVASTLQRQGAAGERVLVLCPSGLDFVAGLFGCIYAGAVAVPVHPPVGHRLMARVASIVADVQAGFALATAESQSELKSVLDGLADGRSLQWCAADAVSPAAAAEWLRRTWMQVRPQSCSTPRARRAHRKALC